jgi:hypothetical protein
MQAHLKKTLDEFDLRLTEVCAATHIESALEKQREIIRLMDNFASFIRTEEIDRETMIEINYELKDLLKECVTNRNYLGDFNNVYETQNEEIIEQIQSNIRYISRILKKQIPN